MTATDRAAALELARYYSDPNRMAEWREHHREAIVLARALLAAEAERERLARSLYIVWRDGATSEELMELLRTTTPRPGESG